MIKLVRFDTGYKNKFQQGISTHFGSKNEESFSLYRKYKGYFPEEKLSSRSYNIVKDLKVGIILNYLNINEGIKNER